MKYERIGRRHIIPGCRLKDPRGERVVDHASVYGYRLRPDADHPHEFMRNWPKVGRLKVLVPTAEDCPNRVEITRLMDETPSWICGCSGNPCFPGVITG